MNDATRELGAALGVAVLGSIAASRYSSSVHSVVTKLPTASQRSARSSLAGALQVARTLPGQAGAAVTQGAQHAFVGGIHLASTVGVALTLVAAMVVWRNLPVEQAHADSPEEVAAFGGELALDASEIPA